MERFLHHRFLRVLAFGPLSAGMSVDARSTGVFPLEAGPESQESLSG